jgi:hypothetical protein
MKKQTAIKRIRAIQSRLNKDVLKLAVTSSGLKEGNWKINFDIEASDELARAREAMRRAEHSLSLAIELLNK